MIKIQKLYRGYKVRCTLDEMKMAAICIQKMLRGKWTRKLYAPLLKWTSTQVQLKNLSLNLMIVVKDKVEEERKRRMERIRRNQRELYILRNTPSQVLEEYYRYVLF